MRRFQQHFIAWIFFSFLVSAAVASSSPQGQPGSSGTIDLDIQKQQKIAEIQARLQSDLDILPDRQVVLLRWLIELLVSTGRVEEARSCYLKILSFYPNDVETLNDFGVFLIESAGDTLSARKVLRDAAQYNRHLNTPAQVAGTTHFLLGKLSYWQGDYSRAVQLFESARLSFGNDPPELLLWLLAQSFERLEQYDQAARTYLELIGRGGGLDDRVTEALRQIHSRAGHYRDSSVEALIERALVEDTARRRAELQTVGAKLVTFDGSEGFPLEGTLYSPDGNLGVLFVTDVGHRRLVWRAYAQLLFVDGISSLAYDLRGHGGSRTEAVPARDRLTAEHLIQFPADIEAALALLDRSTGGQLQRRIVVAEGAACGWVEQALHQQSEATAVLYISPLFDTDNRELAHSLAFRRDRPTLMVFSAEDVLAAASVRYLSEIKPHSRLKIIRLIRAGHGIEALSRDPEAVSRFQNWIQLLAADSPPSPAD
jgi:tetratricopeptide (TPR) repeat protein